MCINQKTHKLILRNMLKTMREELGVRQVVLAQRINRPQSFVSKYETGEKSLTLLELREVCFALGVPLMDFICRLEEEINASKS